MEKEPQKIRLALSPQAGRYARADAPLEARLMAAGGALPLPPIELATVLFALMHDPEAEVKAKARESLDAGASGNLTLCATMVTQRRGKVDGSKGTPSIAEGGKNGIPPSVV